MSSELMNTKETAKYLGIHEKQVYLLIKAGRIPCTKVTGKWIFPRKLIDEWIQTSAQNFFQQARKKISKMERALLAAGSNDPVLDMLLTVIKKDHPEVNIFSADLGSIEGLRALNTGLTDIAFSHLFDPETGDYNVPYLKQYCPDIHPMVVNMFYRQVGFLFVQSMKNLFKGWESLTHKKIRFVNRQEGSGIRVLIDRELSRRNISCCDIRGYENEVFTHFEVGFSIISGEADVGIASAAVAKILDLEFQPLLNERFDMVLDKNTFFQPAVQALMDALKSRQFRNRVQKIGHYDFRNSGRIVQT